MIYELDPKIIEHRSKRRLHEGFHIYSEIARYFKCPECQSIVCNKIEELPSYNYKSIKEFMEVIDFLFNEGIEPFSCPVCNVSIDSKSLIFAHFYIPLFPYNKDLIIEVVCSEDKVDKHSFIIIEGDGKRLEIENLDNIGGDILHPSREAYEKGMELLRSKEVKKAIKLFKRALHYYAYWEEALIEIARCYMLLGSDDKGEKILKRVLRTHPKNINALLLKSWLYYIRNDLVKSEKVCRKILAMDSNIADAYYYLALIELEKGEIENTKSNLEEALRIAPEHIDALKLLYLIVREGSEEDNEE